MRERLSEKKWFGWPAGLRGRNKTKCQAFFLLLPFGCVALLTFVVLLLFVFSGSLGLGLSSFRHLRGIDGTRTSVKIDSKAVMSGSGSSGLVYQTICDAVNKFAHAG